GGVAGHGQVGLETGWRRNAVEGLESDARLLERGQATAQADHTEVALQADAALTLEQRTLNAAGALLDGAAVRLIANFQLEDCFQAVAEFFRALETEGV